MNKINSIVVVTLASCTSCLSFVSLAADDVEKALVAESSRGRWTFSAGPSWRSRVKMETRGVIVPTPPVARETIRRDMNDSANWDRQNKEPDPKAGTGGIPADGELWGVTDTRTEIYGYAGRDYIDKHSSDRSPIGLNLQGCYDVYQADNWSVGVNLRFAGYWNMRSTTSGRFYDSIKQTDVYTDHYVFEDSVVELPFADTVDPRGSKPLYTGENLDSHTMDYGRTRNVTTRIRSDLYQIGLGPKVTWSPFAGWCECMDWLDVYGGVEVLCNLAYTQFDADNSSTSQTDCLLGFGGNLGIVGNVTDWFGIYGQVGYEWIDKTDASTGGFKADIDYSSLVISAGVQFRF